MRKKCVEIKGDRLLFCLISSSHGEPRVFYDSTLFCGRPLYLTLSGLAQSVS
jgi:hypothetical protein